MTQEEFKNGISKALAFSQNHPQRMSGRLGINYTDCGFGKGPWAEFSYSAKEEHLNPYGGVHGGIISALADNCSGVGAVALTGRYVTTTDLTMSFIRPMNKEKFRIRIDYTHVGRTLVRCMGRIYDEDTNMLMATSQATFMAFEGMPPGLRD